MIGPSQPGERPLIMRRVRYALRGVPRPRLWYDNRFLAATAEGSVWRVEFLGLSGIGKTFLNDALARAIGDVAPVNGLAAAERHQVLEKTTRAIDEVFRLGMRKRLFSAQKQGIKYKGFRKFVEAFEYDKMVGQDFAGQPFSAASGMLHWSKYLISDLLEEDPNLVQEALIGRLVVHCSSDAPGWRSIEGRIHRGSSGTEALNEMGALKKEESARKLEQSALALEELGVPVKTVNVDHDVRTNVALIADFLLANGIVSPKITRLAEWVVKGTSSP